MNYLCLALKKSYLITMLQTPRLVIRPTTLSDAENILHISSDPEVMRLTGDRIISNIGEAQSFLENSMIPQFERFKMGRFLVFLKDGTFIGWCGLKYFPETKEVDLGYRFLKSFWGQGFATEASAASMDYGLNVLKLDRIIAKSLPDNVASIKVLQKLKMSFIGYLNDPTDPQSFVVYEKRTGLKA